MKSFNFILSLIAICISSFSLSGQLDNKITVIDFVQILNDNQEEADYYYKNNWKWLREKAIEKGYIHSYQVLETSPTDDQPFHLMLITTYKDQAQYEKGEDHFQKLIEQKGSLRLLNEKQPGEFRKNLFHKEGVRHWQVES